MSQPPILFPFLSSPQHGDELACLEEALRGGQLAGDGPFTRKVERFLAEKSGAPAVLLTDSADSALEIALRLLDIGPGDEVLLPTFNYMPAANACLAVGATPVFVDSEEATLNLDPVPVAAAITPRTRALVPAAYGGFAGQLDALLALARRQELALIEDAALGFGTTFGGRMLGTWGDFGVWCFNAKRHLHGGEAGALVLRDPRHRDKAEDLRERGTNRQKMLRGEVPLYGWVRPGRAALASDLAAAFLWAQLQHIEEVLDRLRGQFTRYHNAFADLEAAGVLRLPPPLKVPPAAPDGQNHANGHLFYFLLNDQKRRDALIRGLREEGIVAGSHYAPLHLEPAVHHLGGRPGDLPIAENASQRLLRLPLHFNLKPEQQQLVIEKARRLLEGFV